MPLSAPQASARSSSKSEKWEAMSEAAEFAEFMMSARAKPLLAALAALPHTERYSIYRLFMGARDAGEMVHTHRGENDRFAKNVLANAWPNDLVDDVVEVLGLYLPATVFANVEAAGHA
jgi:hypothetical protein